MLTWTVVGVVTVSVTAVATLVPDEAVRPAISTEREQSQYLVEHAAQTITNEMPATDVARCAATATRPRRGPAPASTVAFTDPRLAEPSVPRRVTDGGVLEAMPTNDAARKRRVVLRDQIHRAQKLGFDEGGRPLDERLVVDGRVLLRLSSRLDPPQVRAYVRAFESRHRQPAGPRTEPLRPESLEVVRCST